MASGRSFGGGRILGSGRSLSPAVSTPKPPQQVSHSRNSSYLSPSASSLSINSQTSESPASSSNTEDLISKVSVDHVDHGAQAAASSRLVCPICNEEMMTLLQLNRHLDDIHANLEEVEQDEVKTWFKAQMTKAKKFQPLAVLNQKLKGLDVFESNDAPPPPAHSISQSGYSTPEPAVVVSPEELVTRAHWQRPGPRDICSDPICGRRLGGVNGTVNCRKCGKLFCEEHTMYQMKLSRSAQPEPVRGVWCRVCETCYKSREGYNDHNGFERNHTDAFMAIRRKTVDRSYLEVSRLEKRLTKLTQLLANPPPAVGSSGGLWPLSSAKTQQRALEQSVIDWEDDAKVAKCPFCQQEFSNYTSLGGFRRHHCRLCGRVVCGDARTGCSSEVGLNVATRANRLSEKGTAQMAIDVRMCKECKHTVFSKSDFARELSHRPPDQRAYENLIQFERGIRLMLPKFQKLLQALQDPDTPPTSQQLADAAKIRKRLTDSFTQYDTAARRIRDMPTTSQTQQKLQKAVYHQATNFLHLHMLPLKALPKVLKHATPNGQSNQDRPQPGALAAIKYNDLSNGGSGSRASSSSAISAMETEEKELRERLIVLEEQKFFVSEMVADANKRRKFDEVSSLAQNLEDLNREIDSINGQLGQMDFAAVYEREGLVR